MRTSSSTLTQPHSWAHSFAAGPGYLAACTAGLPSDATVDAMQAFISRWAGGGLDAPAVGAEFEDCRTAYAAIVGVTPTEVAIGSQVSQFTSVIAASVPPEAEVLCAIGDFSSLTHPFEQLAGRGVRVRYVPLADLASEVSTQTALVAFSLVQSATGEIADFRAIQGAAARVGARTFVDLTQAVGWLPVNAADFDYTVCHAYKWLCAPRGTAFLTVRAGLETELTPLAAGWYSADDVWASCYAGHTPLAVGAGRFDLSPVWPVISGTAVALREHLARDPRAVHDHALGLANAARAVLEVAPGDSAIVTWADPDGTALAALTAAGITASGRAGNARIAFHLWNTGEDVAQLAAALGRTIPN